MLRTLSGKLISKYHGVPIIQRFLSHYPIDETIFGLNEDQIKVSIYSTLRNDRAFTRKIFIHSCVKLFLILRKKNWRRTLKPSTGQMNSS